MDHTLSPAFRSYDGYFPYRGSNGLAGRCYLQIYEAGGALPVVIATEAADNPGQSVTNAAEALATQVWRQLLPRASEGFRLIEVYRRHAPSGEIHERFAEVELIAHSDQLEVLRWHPSSRTAVEALIGDAFSVPIMSSY